MTETTVTPPAYALSRGTLRHEVVKRLMTEIFRGEVSAGTRLVVQKLAPRFGISSTPIREALLELEILGLVRFAHYRGAVVKPFGPSQVREVYQMRRILESEATRTACARIDRQTLDELRSETADLASGGGGDWSERAMDADRKLHALLAASCGSVRLGDEIGRYSTLVQAMREIVGDRRQAQRRAMEEHLAVIDALAASQADRAAQEMARHIDRTAEDVEAVLFSRRAGGGEQ